MVRLKAAMVVDMDEITELVVGIQTDMAGGSGKGNGSGNMSAIDLIVKDMMVTDHRFTNGASSGSSSGASNVASSVASSSSGLLPSGLLPSGLLPSSSSRPEAKENVVARTARRSMIRRSSSAGVHGKAKLLRT